jgi:hypothetical protein
MYRGEISYAIIPLVICAKTGVTILPWFRLVYAYKPRRENLSNGTKVVDFLYALDGSYL